MVTESARNIALRISYDGARYHGWQTQRGVSTVQQCLTRALNMVCGDVRHVTGCGRTDAGVHALSYCANFFTKSQIPTDRLPYALGSHLPDDIAVSHAVEVEREFNAILSCIKKEYVYKIICSRIRDPFYFGRACFYPKQLDLDKMSVAAQSLIGTHDFAAFRSTGTETRTTVRTIHEIRIEKSANMVNIFICADGFLYNMARAITGTLIYVSEGKIKVGDIPDIIASRSRSASGPTAPPQGLYMNRVWYNGAAGEMMSFERTYETL